MAEQGVFGQQETLASYGREAEFFESSAKRETLGCET